MTFNGRQAGKTHARTCIVIAFTGEPGTGKDSAAAVLVNHRGFRSIAFADQLRREIAAAWRIDKRMLTHWPTIELPILALAAGMCGDPAFIAWCLVNDEDLHAPRSPRWAMRQWSAFQRRGRPSCYADALTRWIRREAALGWRRFAVTDLREEMELQALSGLLMPLHVVRVHSHRAVPSVGAGATPERQREHIAADLDLSNDTTLQALAGAVLRLGPVAALEMQNHGTKGAYP